MGYTRDKVFKLVFSDPEMDGLEVSARPVKLKQVMRLMGLVDKDTRTPQQVAEMLDIFGRALVSWNVEEDVFDDSGVPTGGKRPIPANREGLDELDFDFALEIVVAWMEALMGVAGPLEQRFSSGRPSLEASMPMETLSPNHQLS